MDFLNVMVDNGNLRETDRKMLFPKEERVIIVNPEETSIFELLVMIGSFESKSQARKNWNGANTIPAGWSEFKIGKLKRHLCIWNPTEK